MRFYPRSYTRHVPKYLEPASAAPLPEESARAHEVRKMFLFEGDGLPWMVDVIRAMRLLKNKKRYVEIGTYDKGCLAYVSGLLASDAILVDVDINAHPKHTDRLRKFMPSTQQLHTVVGDSTKRETQDQIRSALGNQPADVIFIDANHTAAYAWADYATALELIAPGGLILFHDVYWQGEGTTPGAALAMEWIDKAHPVHVVFSEDPIHRFFPDFARTEPIWGGVGVIQVEG